MRGIAVVVACALLVAPAMAGDTYRFVVDPNMSFIELGFEGAGSFTYGSSPNVGTFKLELDTASLLNGSMCAFVDVDTRTTQQLKFGFGALSGVFAAGAVEMQDAYTEIPGTLSGAPPIASASTPPGIPGICSGVYVYAPGYMVAIGYFTLDEWIGRTGAPYPPFPYGLWWDVQVAYDNDLGIDGLAPGELEATLYASGQYEVQTGVFLNMYIQLAGQTPEPTSLSLLGLAGLALLRRRR